MKRITGAAIAVATAALPSCASAHGGDVWVSGSLWTYDPWVVTPLYVVGLLYLLGTIRLRRRAQRAARPRHAACFWSAWLALAVALLSPLHWLGDRLFLAHMVEHSILIGVSAPLLVLARPTAAVLWSLPRAGRTGFRRFVRLPTVQSAWTLLAHPLSATLLFGVTLWAWHLPALYRLALESTGYHRLEHLMFSVTAVLFWWALLRRARPGVGMLGLFLTSLHMSLLGLLLTLSTRVWYPSQSAFAAEFGLTPLEDQQAAGLVMWLPMGLIFTAAGLWLAARWIGNAGLTPGPALASEQTVAVAP